MNTAITITIFILYLLMMLGIGAAFYKKTGDLSDYILGGRGLNKWVTSLSAQASDMSGWLLMGLPGLAFATGLSEAFWLALGLAIGTYLNWKLVAKRLRVYTQKSGNSLTLSDYFENRFKENHHILRLISAVFILIFFLVYTVSGFVAGGKLFNSIFGLQYQYAVIIGAVIVISYTFLGGFKAVCWTDFIQGTLMFIAVVVVPIAAIIKIGGPSKLDTAFLSFMKDANGKSIGFLTLTSSMAWGLGYFGMPHILVRFMAIKNADEIKDARKIAISWVLISLAAATIIGIIGHTYFQMFPTEGLGSEKVFIFLVTNMMPSVIAGIFLAAILAAIMSTADSQLLVAASAISEDFYKAVIRKNASEKELVWISRGTVIAIAVIASFFAMNPESSVLALVSFGWAGLGATFGPVIIVSLYWKRMTANGALAGMLAGGLTTIIWKQLSGGIFDLYEIVPGFVLSFILIFVVSLFSKEPSSEVISEFDSVMKEI